MINREYLTGYINAESIFNDIRREHEQGLFIEQNLFLVGPSDIPEGKLQNPQYCPTF